MDLNMSNPTLSHCEKNDEFKYHLYSVIFTLVFAVGLLFNAMAAYIFLCTLNTRNETTTYMLNLVVSDTLFVLSLPFRIAYFIKRDWVFGSVLCKISVSLFYTNMYGSILFLTCISMDRFLAIVHPFRSQGIRTKRNARLACLAVWVMVLCGSIPTGILLDTSSNNTDSSSNSTNFCFENYSKNQWKAELSRVVIFIETVGFILPLAINVFCSVMVLRTLRSPTTISRGGSLNKAKILRMIVVHLLVFCFCFIPYNVNLIFYTLVRSKVLKGCQAEYVVRTIYPIALCIAVTNCCFDPVIYYFTSETIKNSIKRKSIAWYNRVRLLDTVHGESSQNSPSMITKSYLLRSKGLRVNDNESTA
ncbi:lysophosphatidic acid receptor 6-like [Fundulus heteroclitus]|uniref:lysophosphatidic acid receptor 6-like n=1 Tax=Fundulus heteroclitus TaxID=8078 RepID=UPI00165A52DD|nr:lysophosphatidic acid receptor 6-like [Fundulus heteroclitus]